MSEPISFVTIGHVDTGKSSLCGYILYKCGHVSEHEMNKIKKKAKDDKMDRWVWARVLDIYEEEQVKGKTHEFETINFEYEEQKYRLIDTPGHQTFIRSMIEGIYDNVGNAILLVSMIPNEFESSFERGMLKEHLTLARAIGIKNLIIAANKMDVIKWDQKIYDKQKKSVDKFLESLKWPSKKIKWVPMSAYDGDNVFDQKHVPKWVTEEGNCFIESLNKLKKISIDREKIDRLDTKLFAVELNVLQIKEIITAGTSFVMHYNSKECEVTIKKISDKLVSLKEGKKLTVLLSTENKINIGKEKVLFRKDDYTIGFGKPIRIKEC